MCAGNHDAWQCSAITIFIFSLRPGCGRADGPPHLAYAAILPSLS
jgi:hypothetical protein